MLNLMTLPIEVGDIFFRVIGKYYGRRKREWADFVQIVWNISKKEQSITIVTIMMVMMGEMISDCIFCVLGVFSRL